jgi:serpin B
MRKLGSFLAKVLSFITGSAAPGGNRAPATPAEVLAQGTAAFTLNLYHQLRSQGKDNLFFSPYNIALALTMAYAGARGETADQMARVLGFSGLAEENLALMAGLNQRLIEVGNEPGLTLSMASAAWVNATFNLRPEYVKLIRDHLESEIQPLDFCQGPQAQKTINDWVVRETGGRIQELIPQDAFTGDTRLTLTSAVYFLGEWADKFDPDKTAAAPFWVTPEQKVQVPLMHRQDEYFYTETAGWQVLEMPYRNEELSMVVLLPKGKKTLGEMEASLESVAQEKLLRDLHWRQVTVSLPRFEIKLREELSSALQRAGMIAAFGPQADFSGITTREELFLNLVLHQTWVKVEERGTEATAATAGEIRTTAAPVKREPVVFRADHPFLFLIRDRQTGLILFWGRLLNPQAG